MNEYTFCIPCHLIVSYLDENEQGAKTRVENLVDIINAHQDRNGFDLHGENHWLSIGKIPEPTVEENW